MLQVLVTVSPTIAMQKRSMGYAKDIYKKEEEEERRIEKMDKCPRYLKQWVLRCPPEKKMNKIALVL